MMAYWVQAETLHLGRRGNQSAPWEIAATFIYVP